jgi:hypothetical protein
MTDRSNFEWAQELARERLWRVNRKEISKVTYHQLPKVNLAFAYLPDVDHAIPSFGSVGYRCTNAGGTKRRIRNR